MTRHDWVGKVIHKELCQKIKFEPTNKWYMHNSEEITERTELPNQERIRTHREKENYKYLGILEADTIE